MVPLRKKVLKYGTPQPSRVEGLGLGGFGVRLRGLRVGGGDSGVYLKAAK